MDPGIQNKPLHNGATHNGGKAERECRIQTQYLFHQIIIAIIAKAHLVTSKHTSTKAQKRPVQGTSGAVQGKHQLHSGPCHPPYAWPASRAQGETATRALNTHKVNSPLLPYLIIPQTHFPFFAIVFSIHGQCNRCRTYEV